MSTTFYKKVRRHLSDNCPVMKRLVARVGPCTLTPKGDDPFTLLVRCVISQQISTKAAESIFVRLAVAVTVLPELRPADGAAMAVETPANVNPVAKLAKFTDAKFKSCRISGPK